MKYPTVQSIREGMEKESDVDPEVKAVAMCDCPRCMAITTMTNFSAYLENIVMPSLNPRSPEDVSELFSVGMLNSRMMSAANELVDEWKCFEVVLSEEADEDEIPF